MHLQKEEYTQSDLDLANESFWDEICGSVFAKALGSNDRSLNSLKKFDRNFFDYYPYLLKHIPTSKFKGKNVLEVGLGYGSVGLEIAQSGACYTGLDIAKGPVNMMKHRLKLYNLEGDVIQGNILNCPLENESQDFVVSIGCFHHTGDLARCIQETFRVLKKGGVAYIMVYNQFSFRQWRRWPKITFLKFLKNWKSCLSKTNVHTDQRAAYDVNSNNQSCPETIFCSIRQLKNLFSKFAEVKFHKENFDEHLNLYIGKVPRKHLLGNIAKILGLDIYITARK